MDLSPYLKLMTDKKGSDLLITVGSPITIKLNDKNKPVGKTAITAEIAKATAFTIMSGEQKKQFVKDKKIEFDYSNPSGEFKVGISFKDKVVGIVINPIETDTDEAEDEEPEEKPKPVSDDKEVPVIDSTELLDYLKITYQHDGSDLFLTVGSKIKAKIYGAARPISTFVATPELTKKCTYSILTDEQIAQFEQTHDLDFAVSLPDGSARFRGNAFFQRKTVGLVMRYIPSEIPSAEAMGTPEILLELMMAKRGLMLMVGGTGSGKSTTLAAMIDYRNANSPGHILTIEDPVEFSHPNKMSIVNQREVGVDTNSYGTAIKASLREAPDVILIGEIREMETMEAALELANTGHLCVST
ncbi:MAG: Flp pilus assembly complex ATPase component TadA, partial [Proteobacteria bacterium]|nr:Flp pilus assembly complex ATPase component TadA [Pseudomonadota bacterium]